MDKKQSIGHLTAFMTILIWGTTFISTKVLLTGFKPIEILFSRFLMGFIALIIIYPHRLKTKGWKEEIYFALSGLSGVCIYYLLENVALTYTFASNVGVITSAAPLFTVILFHILAKNEEKFKANFFIGFILAMIGIGLISFNGMKLKLNPRGDILAVLAALSWGFYSVFAKKVNSFGYNVIQSTRRIFAYGLLFMVPNLFFFDFSIKSLKVFSNPVYIFNIVFLGILASALCFVTWNYSVKLIGAIKTSIYIYLVPVITTVASVIVLHERVTLIEAFGIVFTLAGLAVSEGKLKS